MQYDKIDSHTDFSTFVPKDNFKHAPIMNIAVISNVWIKMMTFRKKGDKMPGHKHPFDHGTLLSAGSLELEVDGIKTEFNAPAIIFVGKGKNHNLVALEDNTIASCIHALRDGNGVDDIIEPSMIPAGIDVSTIFSNKEFGLAPIYEKL